MQGLSFPILDILVSKQRDLIKFPNIASAHILLAQRNLFAQDSPLYLSLVDFDDKFEGSCP